ncbi:MAG TPA: MG2 domain-containing protein [Polyangiaceae bacterium]|nr:MG2 domain-containing protein [Polyangiaceae bacterium]
MMRSISGAAAAALAALRALADDVRRRELLRPFVVATIAFQLGVVAWAALRGEGAPEVEPRATLEAGPEGRAATAPEGEGLRVVFSAPEGELVDVDAGEVQLVWNRPLRALDAAPEAAAAGARIEPAVPGAWSWVGTRALRFAPKGPWPPATEFKVTVPGGLKSLDDQTMAEPFTLSFTTPKPRVLRVRPGPEAKGAGKREPVLLRFNQPVPLDEVRRAASLEAGGAPVRFAARHPQPGDTAVVELAPGADYPLDAEVTVRVEGSLRGRGPLPMGEAYETSFRTYGPLRVEALQCGGGEGETCRPGAALEVRLTNRVKAADLKRAIKVAPKAELLWPSWVSDNDLIDSLEVPMAVAPGGTYSVRVDGAMRDEHGQALSAPKQAELAFGDAEPALRLGVEGTFLPPGSPEALPFRALNVASAEIVVAPLEPASLFGLAKARRAHEEPAKAFDFLAALPGAARSELAFDAKANRVQEGSLPLGAARRAGGPVAIALRWDNKGTLVKEERVVQFTDLALSAKVSEGSSVAWVTRLSTGEPVPGAKIELWDEAHEGPVASVEADAGGLARFDAAAVKRSGEAHLFVRAGDERSAHALDGEIALGRYDLPTGAPGRLRGLVYGDRGIYRPGDRVRLGGLLRKTTESGLETPAGAKVSAVVRGPEGETFVTFDESLSPAGAFAHEIALPATAKLGGYTVSVSLPEPGADRGQGGGAAAEVDEGDEDDDAPPAVVRMRFEVSEYRPAEFQVQVETDHPAYGRGDDLGCRARGTLLSGAPMAGAPVRTVLVRQDAEFQVPGAEGFVTDDEAYHAARVGRTPRAGQVRSEQAKLDAEGGHGLRARLELPGQRGTERVICEAEVSDLSNQAIAGRAGALVHPGSFYLGVKPPSDGFARAGDVFVPTVIAADPAGARVAGVKAELELIERRWVIARQRAKQGQGRSEATVVDRVAGRCKATTAAEPVPCLLRVPRAGHFVVRATAKDERKRALGASFDVYATGAGEPGWADRDDNRVELVPERPSYKVGDVARFLVKNPFAEAEALVTVEREGVLSSRRVRLAGPAPTVEVPVDEKMVPNAYVGVLLVRGGDAAAAGTPSAPRFRAGYAPIAVDSSARKLRVAVRPSRAEASPGDTIEVEAELRDAAGGPVAGEVTVFAVDEGSLSLTDYRTPEPWAAFFAPRPLGVRTVESREALGRIGRGALGPLSAWESGLIGDDKGLDGGGGGDEGGVGGVRRDFRQTAAFVPGLKADETGRARASFKLPDSLSTFRVMAVAAAADDRAGSGEAKVVASKRLMLRAALPRVLRVGDRFDASVVVTSKGAPAGPVRVKLEAGGVGLLEGGERAAELPERGSAVVRFPVEVTRAGEASFTFTAQAGADQDALEVRRPATPPVLVEAAALYGQTQGAAAESLGDFAALRDDVGGLSVGLSSSALVGVSGGIEWLLGYPYGCSEQLTSQLVPLLAAPGLARSQGVELPKDPARLAEIAVAKLLKHQRYDGGFGLWPEARESWPWVSTYALWGLGLARREKVAVPEDAIARATRYVAMALKAAAGGEGGGAKKGGGGDDGEGEGGATKGAALADAAFAADVLAELGAADPGSMTRLYEGRERLPLHAKALLLHALAVAQAKGGEPAAEGAEQRRADLATLRKEVASALRLDGPAAKVQAEGGGGEWGLFGSPTRTAAMVLRALVAADPREPLAAPLARGLIADRVDGRWRTTQESAWALLALEDYRRAQEASPPSFRARAYVGRELLGEAFFRGPTAGAKLSVPASTAFGAGGSVLSFDVRGKGTLFYEARLTYARREPPKSPIEAGFFVERALRAAGPAAGGGRGAGGPRGGPSAAEGPSIGEAGEGDLVVVEALVATPLKRSFVVVDVPLPAGLEPVDAALATAARYARPAEPDGPTRGGQRLGDYTRRELRDDRVVFFADELAPGVHAYRFLARATGAGDFAMPPAHAEEMYAPEIYGATAAARFKVRPKP